MYVCMCLCACVYIYIDAYMQTREGMGGARDPLTGDQQHVVGCFNDNMCVSLCTHTTR